MTLSVQQSGGDYTTLDEALDNASTAEDINIEGSWTVDDFREAVIAVDCQIACLGTSKHPGFWDESLNHYRLVGNGDHALLLSGAFSATIDGLAIEQEGTGESDEVFRCIPGTSDTVTIRNSLLHCSTNTSQQDCLYTGFNTAIGTVNVEQCMIWGANRGGIHSQQQDNAALININSCTVWNNGLIGGVDDGGIITSQSGATSSVVVRVHNTISVGNSSGSADDYNQSGGNSDFQIDYSIDSDNSIASVDSGSTGSLASRTPEDDRSPVAGDYVIFFDITSTLPDLRIVSVTENDAEDMHSVATSLSITIPTTDIVGTTRATPYECGAFSLNISRLAKPVILIGQAIQRAANF